MVPVYGNDLHARTPDPQLHVPVHVCVGRWTGGTGPSGIGVFPKDF